MKRIALIPLDPSGLGDRLLGHTGNSLNCLQRYLKTKHYELHTIDLFSSLDEVDAIIAMDITRQFLDYQPAIRERAKKKSFVRILLLCECPVIQPSNWSAATHALFDGILTWNDTLVDGKTYFPCTWIQNGYEDFVKRVAPETRYAKKKKFLTLINGNKYASRPDQLYSERRRAIDFFEQVLPDDFDLYGVGWDKPFYVNFRGVRNVLSTFNSPGAIREYIHSFTPPRSYRGPIEDKLPVLSQYKFAICYENMTHINGYITEKIWDCFRARVVPIYWGADNVSTYIPSDCFIDKRQFASYPDLLRFLQCIDKKRYLAYLTAIDSFVQSKQAAVWFDQYWAKKTGDTICAIIDQHL